MFYVKGEIETKQNKKAIPRKTSSSAQIVVDNFEFPVCSTDPDMPSDQTLIFCLWAFYTLSCLKTQIKFCQILSLSIKYLALIN